MFLSIFGENLDLLAMPNPYFQFKQFTVWHDKCAMKVGTDGVLLGAWADVSDVCSVLDIGTGTGLVALMIAQRCRAHIMAVEVDSDAVEQAKENASRSPWQDRIEVVQEDFINFHLVKKFDLIVSNPPYFVDSLQCPDEQRTIARHAGNLTYWDLVEKASKLLSENGRFSLIIPTEAVESIQGFASRNGLHLIKKTYVVTKPNALPKRALLTFGFRQAGYIEDELLIELARHQYSKEYTELTKEFYLKM